MKILNILFTVSLTPYYNIFKSSFVLIYFVATVPNETRSHKKGKTKKTVTLLFNL